MKLVLRKYAKSQKKGRGGTKPLIKPRGLRYPEILAPGADSRIDKSFESHYTLSGAA
jgi:hypothetical protein